MTKPIAIVFKESLVQSLVADAATFGFLLLCIWASQGSTWWTFFSGVLYIAYLVLLVPAGRGRARRVYSTAELRALADEIEKEGA